MAENDEITKLQAELDAIDRDIAALQIKRQDIESKLKVAQGGTAPPNGAPAVEKSGWQHKYPTACTQFPTIVRVDGKLCAISCFIDDCRANVTNAKGSPFFRGMLGLASHVQSAHGGNTRLALDEVAKQCTKAELSDSDAALVEAGQPPVTIIIEKVKGDPKTYVPVPKATGPKKYGDHTVEGPINKIFTHVLKVDGVWVELTCRACDANCTQENFFRGLVGIQGHLRGCHESSIPIAEVLQFCKQRKISDNDVVTMTTETNMHPVDHQMWRRVANHADSRWEARKEGTRMDMARVEETWEARRAPANSAPKATSDEIVDLTTSEGEDGLSNEPGEDVREEYRGLGKHGRG